MGWHLAPNVRYCVASGRVLFLDVARDRYFALPTAQGDAYLQWLAHPDTDEAPPVAALLEQEGLLARSSRSTALVLPEIPVVSREPARSQDPGTLAAIADVTLSLAAIRLRLWRTGLLRTLEALRPTADEDCADQVRPVAACFMAARRRLPLAASCLPDSLAMLDYLNRHRVRASIVFGVTGAPFRAHCWVQLGDEVLNDALDHVAPFTPILQR